MKSFEQFLLAEGFKDLITGTALGMGGLLSTTATDGIHLTDPQSANVEGHLTRTDANTFKISFVANTELDKGFAWDQGANLGYNMKVLDFLVDLAVNKHKIILDKNKNNATFDSKTGKVTFILKTLKKIYKPDPTK